MNVGIVNYKFVIEYDGTAFYGWQSQEQKRTVSGVFETALKAILRDGCYKSRVVAAGRTDRGVHALAQVASFKGILTVPVERVCLVLNSRLPNDVRLKRVTVEDEMFNARFSAKAREYLYIFSTESQVSTFIRNYVACLDKKLVINIRRMRLAARSLLGEKFLKTFCSAGSNETSYFRNIEYIKICRAKYKCKDGDSIDIVKIRIKANAFLYRMVRNIVSLLIDVGNGKVSIARFEEIVSSGDRRVIGKPAPPQGLYLSKVFY